MTSHLLRLEMMSNVNPDLILMIIASSLVHSLFQFQLEYGPCVVPVDCWNLMKELLQGFMGNHAENLSIYLKGKMEQVYAPLDTMQQYLEHFNNFRKVSSGTVSR